MFASRPHRLARSASSRPLLTAARTGVILAANLVVTLLALATPPAAQAQGQTTVTITPSSRVVVGQTTLEVTVLWCAYPPTVWDMDSRSIKVNGVDVTANFDLQADPIACGFYGNVSDEILYKSTGTITVASPQAWVTADVWDWSHTYLSSAVPQTYKLPDPRRRVVVVADAQFQEVRPNAAQAQRFTLYNSGTVRDTLDVSRTCTGTTSGCTLSASSVMLDAGQSTAVTVNFTSGAVGDTGTIRVRAARSAEPTFADSSWTDVSVTAGPATGVTIVGTAPGVGDVVRRGLCVAVAAGSGAAAECGDLRLAHPLPSVRTLGAQRTPTLIYNSQHARPKPLVVANVTLPATGPSGSLLPTTVEGRIYIGGVQRGFASWNGSDWGALGSTRRVVVPGDDQTWTQGRSGITVEMKYIWPNASVTYATGTGTLVVVRRADSPFGAGWWLAGLEQLYWLGTQRMVVGGDGSVRVYNPVGSNLYVSPDPEHPDTLDGTGADYVRKAPDGLRVLFSATTGRQIATINRLGYRTDFYWNGDTGPLDSLRVPTLGSPLTYTFSYSGNLLSAVTAPGGRQVAVFSSSARVDSIQDPDGSRVRFTYGNGVNQYRVATRRDRRGKVTTFVWNDAAQRLTQVQRPLSITTTVTFAETQGLAMAVPVDSAYTLIDGPRTDVADVTKVWVNGHGAPTRIRNAVGRETLMAYAAAWPGLAAVTKGPSGLRTHRLYNTRGLPVTDTVINPLGTGQNAVTQYTWHATWDAVTQMTSPTGLVTTFGYNATYGYRVWEQVGPDQARRVNYGYDGNRLLTSIAAPSGTAYLYYDNLLGNLQRSRSPRGFDTYSYGDALGRDTLVAGTLDSLPGTTLRWSRTRTFYSVMDRVDSVRTAGDSVVTPYHTHHSDTVRVLNVYDAEGNQLTTTRLFRLNGAGRSLSSAWTYDDANRVTGESHAGAGSRIFILDPAGNATTTYTPRGHTITVAYDALNRPSRRVLSQVDYGNIACPAFPGECQLFSFPTREGPTVCFATDTASFDYDAAGNLRRADNGWAWVRRAYTPSGLVAHDTLVVRTYDTSAPYPCGPGDRHSGGVAAYTPDFTSHVYALRYTYDLEGRRDSLLHPDGIDFCAGRCVTRYGYEAAAGLLSSVTDPLGYGTSFAYDAAGRDTATTYPGSYFYPVVMRRGYDADGNVATRSGPFSSGDVLSRDAQGRLVSGAIGDIAGNGPAGIQLRYGPLGAVVYAENLTKGATFEEDSVDAIGNRLWQREYGVRPDYLDRHRRLFLDTYTSRLDSIRLVPPLPGGFPELYTRHHVALYDAAGNSHQTYGWPGAHLGTGWEADLDEAVSYFDAADRLRIFNRHVNYGGVSSPGGVYEEYRYDALGRRVLVRSRCTASQESDGLCRGYVERTVWDGAQVLYELRAPGQDGAASDVMEQDTYAPSYPYTSYDALLGRVGYVHAGGMDAPLAVYRLNFPGHPSVIGVAPHANYQGDFEIGSIIGGTLGGQSSRSCEGQQGCPLINWPGGNTTIDGEIPNPGPPTWFGTLLQERTDGSGLQYLRNRYYDARTGRFTQSDPIGLAGGLNLYGFAAGDPVNFSDPFGLRTCPPHCSTIHVVGTAIGSGFGTVVGATGGVVAGTVVLPVAGTLGGGVAGGAAGAVEGGVVGLAAANVAEGAAELVSNTAQSVWSTLKRGIEIVGFVIGIGTNTPPPKRPDDPPPPPPPVQTGPRGPGEPPLPPGVRIGN